VQEDSGDGLGFSEWVRQGKASWAVLGLASLAVRPTLLILHQFCSYCFFCGLESADVSAVLGCDGHVDNVDSGGVELVIHHIPSCQVSWISW
jgi:hypothetical protein